MFNTQSKIRRLFLFTLFSMFLFLNACGKISESINGGASQNLTVHLVLPEGTESELFWSGVEQKFFYWKGENNQEKRFSLGDVNIKELGLEHAGRLRFEGISINGRILVSGEVLMDGEKQIYLPVQRVL